MEPDKFKKIEKKFSQSQERTKLLKATLKQKLNKEETRSKIIFGAIVMRDYTSEQLTELAMKMSDRDKEHALAWINWKKANSESPKSPNESPKT